MLRSLVLALLMLAAPTWSWPLAGAHTVTRPYLAPVTPYSAGHRGVDLGVTSTTVYAPADGVVHFAGFVVDRPVLSLSHAGGYLSSFEPVTTDLRKGDPVARGDPIGTVERGHCSTPCLHFGVRFGGEYVSPLLLIGEVPRAVLLPVLSSVE